MVRNSKSRLGLTAGMLASGLSLLAGSAFAAGVCPAFEYPSGNKNGDVDIAAAITDIRFYTGADPHFRIFMLIDAADLDPGFRVTGRIGIKVEDLAIGVDADGKERHASAEACASFAPRRFSSAGPYYVKVRLGGVQGTVLPQGKYSASLALSLVNGGNLYQDANLADNSDSLTKEYKSVIAVTEQSITGTQADPEVKLAATVENTGDRPSGPLALHWWTNGSCTQEADAEGIDGGEVKDLEHTFADNAANERDAVSLTVKDERGITLAMIKEDIPEAPAVEPVPEDDPEFIPLNPDTGEPEILPEPMPGFRWRRRRPDYRVGPVQSGTLSLGDGVFVLASYCQNVGRRRGGRRTNVVWENVEIDGQHELRELTKTIPRLRPGAYKAILALLDLSMAEDPSMRPDLISGTLKVVPLPTERRIWNNSRDFELELPLPPEEDPTPPEVQVTQSDVDVQKPESAGEDGTVVVTVKGKNVGGNATELTFKVAAEGLDPIEGEASEFTFEDVGTGEETPTMVVTFSAPKEKYGTAQAPKSYKITISGTSKYEDGDEIVAGPTFSDEESIDLGAFPRAQLRTTPISRGANGQIYIVSAQTFRDLTTPFEVETEIVNLGEVPVTDPVQVKLGFDMPGLPAAEVTVDGAPVGVPVNATQAASLLYRTVSPLTCAGYWKVANRKPFEAKVTPVEDEEVVDDNNAKVDLVLDPASLCP